MTFQANWREARLKNVNVLCCVAFAMLFGACTEETKNVGVDPAADTQTTDSAVSDAITDAIVSDTSVTDSAQPVDATSSDVAEDTVQADTTVSPDASVTDVSATDVTAEDTAPGNPCQKEVLCNSAPPQCEAPLVAVPYKDCWGCGYPDTCSCDDGMDAMCDMIPPECPPELTLAAQDGCYKCVDPNTCKDPEPPQDTCKEDGECMLTAFDTLVTSVDDCFCPMCPNWSVSQAEHQAREAAWNDICSDWAKENPCPVPKCQPPGEPICVQGQCDIQPASCTDGVMCFGLPLDCKEPFVSVAKDGCWACGYPETCSCSIAETPTCKKMTPNCPEGTELAVQGDTNFSCWACVDPLTCLEVKDSEPECKEDNECTMTQYDPATPVKSEEDCYCPMCPTWAVTQGKAAQLQADWGTHCKAWADKEPCLPPPCPPPIGDAQCVDGMCMMPTDGPPPPPAP